MNSPLVKATLAFIAWGLFPIYFDLIKHIPALTTIVYRLLFCFIFTACLVLIFKKTKEFKEIIFKGKYKKKILLAGFFISANWLIYVYAVSTHHVLETSLGYYLAPLISIFIGIFFLKEKVNKAEKIGIFLLCLAIAYKIYSFGKIPWVALGLAMAFACYGFVKKQIPADALPGFSLEALFIMPFSFAIWGVFNYFFFPEHDLAKSLLNFSTLEEVLLILQGVVSIIPLLLFASSVKKLPLSLVGYLTFIAPTMGFFLGIFYLEEEFVLNDMITFAFIWSGLLIISLKDTRLFQKKKLTSSN